MIAESHAEQLQLARERINAIAVERNNRLGNLSQLLVTPETAEHAARLLADLWTTGQRHGIQPRGWDLATDLPMAALDVISAQRRHGQQDHVSSAG